MFWQQRYVQWGDVMIQVRIYVGYNQHLLSSGVGGWRQEIFEDVLTWAPHVEFLFVTIVITLGVFQRRPRRSLDCLSCFFLWKLFPL